MFYLMNKDKVIASFHVISTFDTVQLIDVYSELPIGCNEKNFNKWVKNRHASKHRKALTDYLVSINAYDLLGFIRLTHAVSINDTYWIKRDDELTTWKDVSLFSNDFDEVIQNVSFDGEGTSSLVLSTTSPEFSTDGYFEKCWVRSNSDIYLYKRCSAKGLEAYSEALASEVFTAMKIGIPYEITKYRNKPASKCKLFTDEATGFIPYNKIPNITDDYYGMSTFYNNLDAMEKFNRMLICDAITFNTDRHSGNHGCLYDTETLELVDMAPVFDYNLSLFPTRKDYEFKDIKSFIGRYLPYIGRDFVEVAKHCLTPEIKNDLLNLRGFEYSFEGDELCTRDRVKYLSDLSNQQIDMILDIKQTYYNSPGKKGLSNIYKYKIKYSISDEEFEKDKPRVMDWLKVDNDEALEKAIEVLL